MPERPQLEGLKLELLRGGVSPVYIERTMIELKEHYEDLAWIDWMTMVR